MHIRWEVAGIPHGEHSQDSTEAYDCGPSCGVHYYSEVITKLSWKPNVFGHGFAFGRLRSVFHLGLVVFEFSLCFARLRLWFVFMPVLR